MLCYGNPSDVYDEYIRIAESTANNAFKHFVLAVVTSFGEEYLRAPTAANVRKHLEINKLNNKDLSKCLVPWTVLTGPGQIVRLDCKEFKQGRTGHPPQC
jgi:hypothetical protein